MGKLGNGYSVVLTLFKHFVSSSYLVDIILSKKQYQQDKMKKQNV